MDSLTGGQIVVRTLRDLGARRIFSVSGNQILPIYDAAGACGLRIFHIRTLINGEQHARFARPP